MDLGVDVVARDVDGGVPFLVQLLLVLVVGRNIPPLAETARLVLEVEAGDSELSTILRNTSLGFTLLDGWRFLSGVSLKEKIGVLSCELLLAILKTSSCLAGAEFTWHQILGVTIDNHLGPQ